MINTLQTSVHAVCKVFFLKVNKQKNKMRDNKNISAYPFVYVENSIVETGLTKREYFLAAVMQGLLSNPEVFKNWVEWSANKTETMHDIIINEANTIVDKMTQEQILKNEKMTQEQILEIVNQIPACKGFAEGKDMVVVCYRAKRNDKVFINRNEETVSFSGKIEALAAKIATLLKYNLIY
jgi:hypothetical protein